MTLANKTEVGCTPLLHETIFAIQLRNGTAINRETARGFRLSVNFVVLEMFNCLLIKGQSCELLVPGVWE